MTKRALLLLLPAFALAACGEEPAAEPAPVETATAEPAESLAAPDENVFASVYAAACPDAEPVNTSVCKRLGIGSADVLCEYGLGDDEYLRNKATLTPGDGEWTIADPETVCAAGA
ncbi:hypothetical protein [Erythrobacter litoralis]|uniref:Lipoprotein n=1 Tax=Erythrobacter litoralis (strain HTCC2594) TaxID=314225 RepID=Q2N8Z3_ERYLH|nr:hypothetical protein [Erythrobacter litoralis]ABC63848.1 hypothetical protein ELI_08780 [Erythrobacter litoralis HTCC2594]